MQVKIYFIDQFVKEATYDIHIPEWGRTMYTRSIGDAAYSLSKLYKGVINNKYGKSAKVYYISFAHNFNNLIMKDLLFGADEYYFDRNNIIKVIDVCELIKDTLLMIRVGMNVNITDEYIENFIDGLIFIGKINADLKYIVLEEVKDMQYAREAEYVKTLMFSNIDIT